MWTDQDNLCAPQDNRCFYSHFNTNFNTNFNNNPSLSQFFLNCLSFSSKCIFPKCIFLMYIFVFIHLSIYFLCIYPKCIFAKCTPLACLLSFASLFQPVDVTLGRQFQIWILRIGDSLQRKFQRIWWCIRRVHFGKNTYKKVKKKTL